MDIVNLHLNHLEMVDSSYHGINLLLNQKVFFRFNRIVKALILNHQKKMFNNLIKSKDLLKSIINNKKITLIKRVQMKKNTDKK